MNKTNSIKKNYIFNLIYQILLVVIPLIVTPYISRVLLADGIGRFSFASSLITYFTIFASFGFDSYAQREIANNQNKPEAQSKTFWEILISRGITIGASLAIQVVLLLTGIYGEYQTLMLILTINIVAILFDISFFFQGNEEFGKLVTRNVIIKVLGTALIFIFIKEQQDLWLYALINSLIIVLSNISLWPTIAKRLKKTSIKQLKPLRHLKQSFKLFVPTIAISLYTVLDKTLIGLISQSATQNGYYEQTEKIIKIAMTLITCMSAVMIPRNSSEIAKGNHDIVKENIYRCFNFVWVLGLPMMFGFILISRNLVPWFLGINFTNSTILLQIFTPLIIIIGCSNILGMQYMIPYKKEKQYTISLLVGFSINFCLNLILIYYFQALGATIATIIAELSVTITMFIFVRKELSFKEIFKTIIKPLIASIIMFICVLPFSLMLTPGIINTLILAVSGIAVYTLLIFLLKENLVLSYLKMFWNKIKKHQK